MEWFGILLPLGVAGMILLRRRYRTRERLAYNRGFAEGRKEGVRARAVCRMARVEREFERVREELQSLAMLTETDEESGQGRLFRSASSMGEDVEALRRTLQSTLRAELGDPLVMPDVLEDVSAGEPAMA